MPGQTIDLEDLFVAPDRPDFIPGIFNYCNRRCERCAYRGRCRLYADEREQERISRHGACCWKSAAPPPARPCAGRSTCSLNSTAMWRHAFRARWTSFDLPSTGRPRKRPSLRSVGSVSAGERTAAKGGSCLTCRVRCTHADDNRLVERSDRDSAPSSRETPPDVGCATSHHRDRGGFDSVAHQTRAAFSRASRMAVPPGMCERHGRAEAAPGGAPA